MSTFNGAPETFASTNEIKFENQTGSFSIDPNAEYVTGDRTNNGKVVFTLTRWDGGAGREIEISIPEGFTYNTWAYAEDGNSVLVFFYRYTEE